MKSEDYIKGRLEGLYQLVSLLRDVITEEDAKGTIVQKLVDHIYVEIEEILDSMGEQVHPEIKEKVKTAKQSQDVHSKVSASYDVLSELIQKKNTEG
jgi:undecaprenyl pyrophosphate synthase